MSNENRKKLNERIIKITLSKGIWALVIISILLFLVGQILYVEFMPSNNTINDAIGALSSFYSMIFTIVAIFIGIAGLIAWRWIRDEWAEKEKKLNQQTKELNQEWDEMKAQFDNKYKELSQKYEEFKEVEKKVDFLNKKRELAKWVQDLFDKDDEKKIISSTALPISTIEDKDKYKNVEEHIIDEATDDSWLKIVYAKKLMEHADKLGKSLKRFSNEKIDKKEKNFFEIQNTYKRVEKIFEFIENRDLFNHDSDVEMILHNLQGRVYWEWYKAEKLDSRTKNKEDDQDEKEMKTWKKWWMDDQNQYKLLKKSVKKYRKALDIVDQKGDPADETLGNLALVLIEISKFIPKESKEKGTVLKEAIKFLEKKEEKDYNTYWDHARALYYLNENKDQIEKLLDDTVKEIDYKKDRDFFIERLEAELNERIDGKPGFPGDEKIIERRKEYFRKKKLS